MPVARTTDPLTSHLAAASVTMATRNRGYQAVLTALNDGPKTDGQIEAFIVGLFEPLSSSGLRTRRKELVDDGSVIDTGRREQLASGRWSIVWGVPGTEAICPNVVGDVSCGMRLRSAVSSATMLEGRCPIHGWQSIVL